MHLEVDRDAAIFLTLGQGSGMKHDDKAPRSAILHFWNRLQLVDVQSAAPSKRIAS